MSDLIKDKYIVLLEENKALITENHLLKEQLMKVEFKCKIMQDKLKILDPTDSDSDSDVDNDMSEKIASLTNDLSVKDAKLKELENNIITIENELQIRINKLEREKKELSSINSALLTDINNIKSDTLIQSNQDNIKSSTRENVMFDKGIETITKDNPDIIVARDTKEPTLKSNPIREPVLKSNPIKENATLYAPKFDKDKLFEYANDGNLEAVMSVVNAGTQVNVKNKNGYSPLLYAVENGHVEVVKFLVSKGALINAKYNDGWTALMIASQNGHIEIVDFLLKRGAKKDLKNNNGNTAYEVSCWLANHQNEATIKKLLK